MLYFFVVAKSVSIRAKLILLGVLSIAVPFAVVGAYAYAEHAERVAERSRSYSERLLRQIAVGVERYLKTMADLSLAPLYDEELVSHLKRRTAAAAPAAYSAAEFQTVMRFFAGLRFDRNEIHGFSLFAPGGARFSYAEYFSYDSWSAADRFALDRASAAAGALLVVPPSTELAGAGSVRSPARAVRALREPFTHAPIGFVQVEFSPVNLERAVFPALAGQEDYILLVYNAQEELIYPESLSPKTFVARGNLLRYEGKDYLASSWRSEPSGLTLYGLVPYADVVRETRTLTYSSALIAAASLLLSCFLAILFADRIVSPLRHLAERMASVKNGRFDARAEELANDEVGELAEDFNLMAAEIQRLIDEVYRVKVKEQEAEIMLLQSRIDPHFLYNTLETVSMMAVERGRMDISDTVAKLGKMLRYSSAASASRVPLASELSLAKDYMALQTLRLGTRLSLSTEIDPSLEGCLLPKLSLQPLVENVVAHGLGERPVRAIIGAAVSGGDLTVFVEDDGKGLDDREAAALEERIRRPEEGEPEPMPFGTVRRGVALRNIHQRIELLHGAPYGLSVRPRAGGGARFEIRVPLERGGADA